jgi:hypothetical protein
LGQKIIISEQEKGGNRGRGKEKKERLREEGEGAKVSSASE